MGNGMQMSIFDSIKNGNNQDSVVLKEIQLEDMTGFICKKCEKYYPRVPLIGVCECGGTVLFSSSQGPAEFVITEN